ncbi:MAG: polysaccharide biosynthesis C-terminal domain-containing protein [Actinomycetota bacterium]|nr:polysaccharide biosynthesis C-terminal domain-containing protein [Actinomycetota bacterium]
MSLKDLRSRVPRAPRLVGDVSLVATAAYAATAAQLVRGVVIARILGPYDMGALAIVGLVLAYAQYSDLGVIQAASRDISMLLGKAEESNRLAAVKWHGFVVRISGALVVSIGLMLYVIVRREALGKGLAFGLQTAAIAVLLQAGYTALQSYATATQRFGAYSSTVVTLGLANLAAGVVGGCYWGLEGVYVGQLLAFAIVLVVAAKSLGFPSRTPLELALFARLVRYGLLLATLTFVGYNLINIDQVMVVSLLGRSPLGLYTIVLYAGGALYLLPTAVAAGVGPRLLRAYGSTADVQSVRRHTWRPVYVLSVVAAIAILASWVLLPWFIGLALPKYAAAVGPLRIYLVGMYFLSVNLGVSTILSATDHMRESIVIVAGIIVLNVVLDIFFVRVLGLGLKGIALGSAVTYMAYYCVHLTYVASLFVGDVSQAAGRVFVIALPGAPLVALLATSALDGSLESSGIGLQASILLALAVATMIVYRNRLRERVVWGP